MSVAEAAFVSVDAHGIITSWNAAMEQLLGWPREQTIHLPVASVLGGGECGIGLQDLDDAQRHGAVTAIRRLSHQDGSTRDTTTTVLAVRNDSGAFAYGVLVHP